MSPKQQRKMPPVNIPCPCGGKLKSVYPRTTHDGRTCESCGKAVLTCFWCQAILCDWQQGPANSDLAYMPKRCSGCGVLLRCD